MQGNYDAVAGFYDRLSRLVFGDTIYRAQCYLVKAIPPKANILIIGGGTGWILEEIAKVHPAGLSITYIESSEKMMQLSRRRRVEKNQVIFIRHAIQDVRLEKSFDLVITPFLFDNFSAATLRQVFLKINSHLKQQGLWLYADFQTQENKLSSKVLLKVMYLFFGLVCKIEASRLADPTHLFYENGYRKEKQAVFYGGFISAIIYQKQPL